MYHIKKYIIISTLIYSYIHKHNLYRESNVTYICTYIPYIEIAYIHIYTILYMYIFCIIYYIYIFL